MQERKERRRRKQTDAERKREMEWKRVSYNIKNKYTTSIAIHIMATSRLTGKKCSSPRKKQTNGKETIINTQTSKRAKKFTHA